MPEPHHDARSAWLLCALLALGPGACTIANRQPETLGPAEETADAGQPDAAPGSPSATNAAMSGSAGDPGASGTGGSAGSGGAAGSAGAAPSSADSGSAGSSGDAAVPDAASPQPSDDASTEDAARVDDVTCAFELSACLILDPLNFEACFQMNMQRCNLLADAAVPQAPSPACSMQTAECIMKQPDKAQECLDKQASCTL